MTFKDALIRNSLNLLAADQHDVLLKKPVQSASDGNKGNRGTKKTLTSFANQAYVADVKPKVLTADEVVDILRRKQGDQSDASFAEELGITPSYLCDLYKGRRTPGDKILKQLGLVKREQQPTYECA